MSLVYRTVFSLVFLLSPFQFIAQVDIVPILDSSSVVTINSISIQGNNKTKEYIILREITFKKGDSMLFFHFQEELDRSQKNIFNTALFVISKINAIQSPEEKNRYNIIIELKERFFIIPEPVFELYDRNYKEWRKIYDSDWERIKYGVRLKHFNASGKRDIGRLTLINGFSKEIGLSYNRPFIDKKLQHGAGVGITYSKRLGSSYGDSLNAGLPRRLCDSCDKPAFKQFYVTSLSGSASYQYRKGLYGRHFINFTIASNTISDSIFFYNKNYFGNQQKKIQYIDLGYGFVYSKVDYFAYPTIGNSVNTGIRTRISSGKINQTMLYVRASKFYPIQKKWFVEHSIGIAHRFCQSAPGFYNQLAFNLRYPNIRGFEQFLILSKTDFVTQNAIRYKFFDKIIKLPVTIRNHEKNPLKVYGRLFADAAYAQIENPRFSKLNNQWLSSGGIALDIVTLYDYVFRFELSYNRFTKLSFYIR